MKDKTGALKKRTVIAGSASAGKMPILAGLEPGEQVVVQGAILLDNQIQLELSDRDDRRTASKARCTRGCSCSSSRCSSRLAG